MTTTEQTKPRPPLSEMLESVKVLHSLAGPLDPDRMTKALTKMADRARDLEAQRDALLAACEAAREFIVGSENPYSAEVVNQLESAIAAAKAGKGEK